jgi:predicted dehydrogenase
MGQAVSEHRQLLASPEVDAVLIATRHASHARLVMAALEAGKHVFVEKPLCLDEADGRAIMERAAASQRVVRVGFNRRFSPFAHALRKAVGGGGPQSLYYRVNLGRIGEDWSNTEEEGGRLLGEAVHFLDFCNWWMQAYPLRLAAVLSGERGLTRCDASVQMEYPGGSRATVVYCTWGHTSAGKEWIEVMGNGRLARIDDFRRFQAFGSRVRVPRAAAGDKGHREELVEFAHAVLNRPYAVRGADARDGWAATWMARAIYAASTQRTVVELPAATVAAGEMP